MDDSFIEIYFFQLWDYLSGILLSSNKIADYRNLWSSKTLKCIFWKFRKSFRNTIT